MEDEITELRYIIDEQNRRIAKLKSEHPCEVCKMKDGDIDKMKANIDELRRNRDWSFQNIHELKLQLHDAAASASRHEKEIEEYSREIRGLTRTNARLNVAVNALHEAFMSIVEVEFGAPKKDDVLK